MDSEAEQTKKRAQAAYLLDQIAEKQREKAERERELQELEERERARDDFDPYARPAVTAADKARARVRGDLAAPARPPPPKPALLLSWLLLSWRAPRAGGASRRAHRSTWRSRRARRARRAGPTQCRDRRCRRRHR